MKSSHSNLRAHRVFAAIAAIFTTCAHAILDTNSNGLSDLWEKQYNQGNLFPNTFLPTSDPDLDGWNNMTESIAGTNPLDANQPSGILQPHIQATSATGFFQIDLPTVLGKNYQLQGSADLVSWLDINDAVLARQEQLSSVSAVATNTGGLPAHFFWRVLIRDNDSDDDGLTDSEETTLQTNPYYNDTDNDGIADKNEILRSLDPLNPDTDSDTLYDGREDALLTNPNMLDTDSDTINDGDEFYNGTNPLTPDTDSDGLSDLQEKNHGTNPLLPDTDGDGINDGTEITNGTNPLANDSDGDGIKDNLDATPLQNNAISDPDNIGLPASLATDFIGNWDFETLFTRTNPPAGHTAIYFDDLTTSNRDATSFSVNNTTDGMVSKAANHTQTFSHIHRSLLQDRGTFTISLWAKIPADAIANNAAGLFTHHNYEPVVTNGTPNWGLISATTNGLWLQKNGNNIELHAGSYLYTNWQYVNSQIQLRNPPLTLTKGVVKTYAPGVINDDRWHHIVMIRVSGTTKLYVDNILEGSSTDPLFTVNNNNYSACSIGRLYGYSADTGLTQPATNPFLFKGKIDRLKVWKRGLTTSGTTSEVAALYQQDIDNDGLWDITENNTKLWRDTNSNGIQEL